MRSLLAPLVFGLVLSLAAVYGVQWSIVRAAIESVMNEYIAAELSQEADELFSALNVLPNGELTLALAHFDPVFLTPYSGRYYQILLDGRVVLRSPSLVGQPLAMAALESDQRRVEHVAGPKEQALLLSEAGYRMQGKKITIAVAVNMRPMQTRRATSRDSSNSIMPSSAVPTAPMPVHTA